MDQRAKQVSRTRFVDLFSLIRVHSLIHWHVVYSVLPKEISTNNASKRTTKDCIKQISRIISYEEAAQACRERVELISAECRRNNQKFLDPDFDIEYDLKRTPQPKSVKRVGDIFENPQFFINGATPNDVRQGSLGDCWFMSALDTLGNKPGLIERVCVARDEEVGIYGFVFHRDGGWISEVIDDKLYLLKPDYDESWDERNLLDEDRQRITSEEDYRKIFQVISHPQSNSD